MELVYKQVLITNLVIVILILLPLLLLLSSCCSLTNALSAELA